MARASNTPSPRRSPVRGPKTPALSLRTRLVWGAFAAAMTLGSGLLLALDSRPAPRTDGFTLPALVAAAPTSSIESIWRTRAEVPAGRWKAIVIHHSGQSVGTPASIAEAHESAGLRGLGHHFLIGNGAGMGDGELHVGYRWLDQLPGAHASGPNADWYNINAISICLVGDGNRRPFTQAQLSRLAQLIDAISRDLGISAEQVLLHSDIAPTNDPGLLFPAAALRVSLSAR